MTAARARLSINLAAIAANWQAVRAAAMPAETGAAVKADAYGLGLAPVAQMLWAEGCRDFFVATIGEAEVLRATLAKARIHLLNGLMAHELDACVALDVQPVLNAPEQIALWRRRGQGRPCDIMVDTGIHRLGNRSADATADRLDGLALDVLMSHLACADVPDHPLNATQQALFADIARQIPALRRSLANSAGVMLGPDYHFDLVRPGLALYGGNPRPGHEQPFAPVMQVDAQVIQIRDLTPGKTVGYGATWTAQRPSRIATLAIGYADGYLTRFSNAGHVALAGALCPVVGRVSMDLLTVDVTAAPGAAEGDWAIVLGGPLPLEASAAIAGLNQYELLTGLGARFDRRYEASA